MKYLISFNESIEESIIEDCEYILSEFKDNNNISLKISHDKIKPLSLSRIKIVIHPDYSNTQRIDILKLKEFEIEFNQLISYIESTGYTFDENSTVYNGSWDPVEVCHRCENMDKNRMLIDYEKDTGNCLKCNYQGSSGEFLSYSHRVTKGEFLYMIENNYYVEEIFLIFKKNREA